MKSVVLLLLIAICLTYTNADGPSRPSFGARFLKTKGSGAVGNGQIYLNKKDLTSGRVCVNECETDQDCVEEGEATLESRKCSYGLLDKCYVTRCI